MRHFAPLLVKCFETLLRRIIVKTADKNLAKIFVLRMTQMFTARYRTTEQHQPTKNTHSNNCKISQQVALATLHDNCLVVIYVLILARLHTSKAVLLHHVTPALALVWPKTRPGPASNAARPGLKCGPAAHTVLRNRNATSHATSKRRPPPTARSALL